MAEQYPDDGKPPVKDEKPKDSNPEDRDWVILNPLNFSVVKAKRRVDGPELVGWDWHWVQLINSATIFTKSEAEELLKDKPEIVNYAHGNELLILRSQDAFRFVMDGGRKITMPASLAFAAQLARLKSAIGGGEDGDDEVTLVRRAIAHIQTEEFRLKEASKQGHLRWVEIQRLHGEIDALKKENEDLKAKLQQAQEASRIDDLSKTLLRDLQAEIIRLRDSRDRAEGKASKYAGLLAEIYCLLTGDASPEAVSEECYADSVGILRGRKHAIPSKDLDSGLTFGQLKQANALRCRYYNSKTKPLSLDHLILALCGEAGELAQEAKRFFAGEEGATMDTMLKELADVVIYADLIAYDCGSDLGTAITAKFNETSDKIGSSIKLGT
jgi:NTP pyrophosphatase (non-canonical NTP hydrolase)